MKINKTTVLTVLSIAGVAATTVTTAIMAPKAERAIKAKQVTITYNDGYSEHTEAHITKTDNKLADKLELVKTAAPYYAPVILFSALTIGLIIINHRESKKELLALSAGTSYLIANRDKIKDKIMENPQAKKLVKSLIPTKDEFKHQTIEETGEGDLLIIEGYSGRIFRSSIEAVEEAEKKVSDMFLNERYACLNDFYKALKIELTHFGHQWGWVNEEDYYDNQPLDFENTLVKASDPGNEWGEDLLCIDLYTYPMECWQEV